MHKAERPSDYIFQFFHILSGCAGKERSNLCQNFVRIPIRLNTVESIFKVKQHQLHTCLGHSNVEFILLVLNRYTCIFYHLINACSVHVTVHG